MGEAVVGITFNGDGIFASKGSTVAAALLSWEEPGFRKSVCGELRGPLCGMGVCMECRVTINGRAHQKACQIIVQEGMAITTDE